jgi:hypothetical protein
MTKQEIKLKSMLNYYQIDLVGKKDEKLSKKDLDRFLDKFNQVLDYYMLQEIIQKIKDGNPPKNDNPPDDLDGFENEYDEDESDEFNDFINKNNEQKSDSDKDKNKEIYSNSSPKDVDINNFLKWLTLIMYSGDYTVVVNDDGKTIDIKLIRNNKGKK